MNKETWVVCGGGIRAIFAAYLLIKKKKRVIIYNKAPFLGGVLFSEEHNGFYLDKGCHIFANTKVEITDLFMELFGEDNFQPIDISIASILNGTLTEEIALPDLTSLGEEVCKNILFELLNSSVISATASNSLVEELKNRFGPTAVSYLAPFFEKAYQTSATDVSKYAIKDLTLSINRLKILPDNIGSLLKHIPILDDRLAIASQKNPMRFIDKAAKTKYNYATFYPNKKGLRSLCDIAKERLSQLGVEFIEGERIQAISEKDNKIHIQSATNKELSTDKLFWAANIEDVGTIFSGNIDTKSYMHKVPMVLIYFFVNSEEISKFSYIHNFELETPYFRVSIPPNYCSTLAPKGKSYLCCEIPTKVNSEIWNNPVSFIQMIWHSFVQHQVVADIPIPEYKILKTPVSYKVPKMGWEKQVEEVRQQLPKDKIFGISSSSYSKNNIVASLISELANV